MTASCENVVKVILAQPRGFCAGVERAVRILDMVTEQYTGRDVYVLHEIVHNSYVVENFKKKNVQFVHTLDDIPPNGVVVFSAHGVSSQIRNIAKEKNLVVVDATCPLVTKVHLEIKKYSQSGKQLILIGHKGHREVEGSMGQITDNIILVQNVEDVHKIELEDPTKQLAYVTQTTLSVDDTKKIVGALKERFPDIVGPNLGDICYATQNRQNAVVQLSSTVDVVLVIGSSNSSNSTRLLELAKAHNSRSFFIGSHKDIHLSWFTSAQTVGITSGASAPDALVQEVLSYLGTYMNMEVTTMDGVRENVVFKLPKLENIP